MKAPKELLRFKQIIAAQWNTEGSDLTYSLYGLTEDGRVFRKHVDGWKAVPMNLKEED